LVAVQPDSLLRLLLAEAALKLLLRMGLKRPSTKLAVKA
jgi:hypothetical protein